MTILTTMTMMTMMMTMSTNLLEISIGKENLAMAWERQVLEGETISLPFLVDGYPEVGEK